MQERYLTIVSSNDFLSTTTILITIVRYMEKLQKHSSVPNIFARFFKSFTPRTVNYQNGTLYSRSATALKQHNLERVKLRQMLNSLPERQQKRWMSFQQFIMHEQNYLDAMRKLQYVYTLAFPCKLFLVRFYNIALRRFTGDLR